MSSLVFFNPLAIALDGSIGAPLPSPGSLLAFGLWIFITAWRKQQRRYSLACSYLGVSWMPSIQYFGEINVAHRYIWYFNIRVYGTSPAGEVPPGNKFIILS